MDSWDTRLPNSLLRCTALNNRYLAMRHGFAYSNASRPAAPDGVLVGSLERDTGEFGLTAEGRTALQDRVAEYFGGGAVEALLAHEQLVILSSPFQRARESAQVLADALHEATGREAALHVKVELSERGYGMLEGESVHRWQELLRFDTADPVSRPPCGAESVLEIFSRLNGLISECEREHAGAMIYLVSHSDPIQVLRALFSRSIDGHYSRHLAPANAEFVALELPKA